MFDNKKKEKKRESQRERERKREKEREREREREELPISSVYPYFLMCIDFDKDAFQFHTFHNFHSHTHKAILYLDQT